MNSWQEVDALTPEKLSEIMTLHMHMILAPGPLGVLPWQFIIVAAAQLEFEALRVVCAWDIQLGNWQTIREGATLKQAAQQLRDRCVFPLSSDVLPVLDRIADLRNDLVHASAAQDGVQVRYEGGDPFTDIACLKRFVWDYDRTRQELTKECDRLKV